MEFYVYTLADPWTKAVFYVGKGKGKRAWQHVHEVRRGKVNNPAKTERIQAILKRRREPLVELVQQHMSELDALSLEERLIATLPNLTNIDAKGLPSAGRFDLRKWLAMVETWPNGPDFPGMYNGHIHAHNFVVHVRRLLAEKDSTGIHEGRSETGGWKTGRVT
jgi:hypothetical protein